jgi:hypothetical protein
MTEQEKTADAVEVKDQTSADAQTVEPSVEDIKAERDALKAEAEKNSELLKKLRKFEKENKDRAEKELLAANKYKELYEAAQAKISETESKFRAKAADEKLKELLSAEKAKSIPTVMKLIDRSKIEFDEDGEVNVKSLAALVKSVKETDSILFDGTETPAAPNLKRATEGDVTGGYEKELASINYKTKDATNAIYNIMKKYNKL